MGFKIDWNAKEEKKKFECLPAGSYKVDVTDAKEKADKNGNPYISLTLSVSEQKFFGKKIFCNLMFYGWAKDWTITKEFSKQAMQSLGVDTEEIEAKNFIDKSAIISVIKESRQDKNGDWNDVNKVTEFSPYTPDYENNIDPEVDTEDIPF